MQTITDLWNGNIAPCEHCGAHDEAVKELTELMARNCEALREGLTAAQKETFQKYIDCTEEYLLRMLELAFFDGFSLGSRLVVESILQKSVMYIHSRQAGCICTRLFLMGVDSHGFPFSKIHMECRQFEIETGFSAN